MPLTLPQGRRFVPAGSGGPTTLHAYDTGLSLPTGAIADDSTITMGLEFYATGAAQCVELRFWQPTTNSPSSATRTGALWRVDSSSTGTNLSGTQSFPPTTTGWNVLTLSSPVTLVANQRYRACVNHPDGRYVAISNFYTTAGGGENDLTNGILTVPTAANATGNNQNSFIATGMDFPTSSFNNTFYGLDVGVVAT